MLRVVVRGRTAHAREVADGCRGCGSSSTAYGVWVRLEDFEKKVYTVRMRLPRAFDMVVLWWNLLLLLLRQVMRMMLLHRSVLVVVMLWMMLLLVIVAVLMVLRLLVLTWEVRRLCVDCSESRSWLNVSVRHRVKLVVGILLWRMTLGECRSRVFWSKGLLFNG